MKKMNSRIRKLWEIRSKNSFGRKGFNPKTSKISTLDGEFTYKDFIILK